MNVQPHSQLVNAWKNRPAADPAREKQIREQPPGKDFRPADLLMDGLDGFIDGASLIIGPGAAFIPVVAMGCLGATLGVGGAFAGALLGLGAVAYTALEKSFPGDQPTTRADLQRSQADLVGDKLDKSVCEGYTVLQSGERQMLLKTYSGRGRAVLEDREGKPVEMYCERGIEHDDPVTIFGRIPHFLPGFSMSAITAEGDIYSLRKKGDHCVVKGPGSEKTVFHVVG